MVPVKAKVVDSTHLELAKPIPMRKGLTVLVSVAESEHNDDARQQWLAAPAQSLSEAYGESEPDYSASLVKERDRDYTT